MLQARRDIAQPAGLVSHPALDDQRPLVAVAFQGVDERRDIHFALAQGIRRTT